MKIKNAFLLWLGTAVISAAALISCSGGGGVTAGVGSGSGIGGTGGLTTVEGNIASVTANLQSNLPVKIILATSDFFITSALAQSNSINDIQVSGGGRTATTDQFGQFVLADVTPSNSFVLSFTLPNSQRVDLNIGVVPEGSLVDVIDITISSSQAAASAQDIDVQDNDDNSEDNDSLDDNSSDDDSSDDDDSVDD